MQDTVTFEGPNAFTFTQESSSLTALGSSLTLANNLSQKSFREVGSESASNSNFGWILLNLLWLKFSTGEFNEVYAAWLEGTILPARAAYGVRELPAGAKVEVVARAVRGSGSD